MDVSKTALDLLDRTLARAGERARGWLRGAHYATRSANGLAESWVFPALESALEVEDQLAGSLVASLREGRGLRSFLAEAGGRLGGALRFPGLVHTVGRTLFGSAVLPGEAVVAEDEYFRLVHVPPAAGVPPQPLALFHSGGAIPYGDRLFRLAPGFDFYGHFARRGLPVYVMELKGDRLACDCGRLDMDGLIDRTARLSSAAWEHNGRRRMVLEGYCGNASQALAYLAARPEDATRKFSALATFVAPVDGRRCTALADFARATPEGLVEAQHWLAAVFGGGYLSADGTRLGIDLPLRALFHKSYPGLLAMGWQREDLSGAAAAGGLTPAQERDLAGAYWVSPANARRWPIPEGIGRYMSALFTRGVDGRGNLPWSHGGEPLSLRAVAAHTDLRVYGFFGGRDPVVPDASGHVLHRVFGDRYRHVVHPDAGHVSYVLSPEMWDAAASRRFDPNPIDLLLEDLYVA